MNVDSFQLREVFGFGEMGEKVQKDRGVESTGEGDEPFRSIAPRVQGLQKIGGEVRSGSHLKYHRNPEQNYRFNTCEDQM
ncbi:hypothetical protein EMIT0P44_30256 [Pseudomonas sp. IT-P44]